MYGLQKIYETDTESDEKTTEGDTKATEYDKYIYNIIYLWYYAYINMHVY